MWGKSSVTRLSVECLDDASAVSWMQLLAR